MVLCRYYAQGNCRFGNSCKFEHPSGGGNSGQSSNRFGILGGGSNLQFERALEKYFIKIDTIAADLTTEKPTWILSAYAPGRDAPDQLFGGFPREQSFEEMRLHYMKGKAEGNEQKALADAQELYQNAQAQMQTAAQNPTEAARYLLEGENRHPNRLDICREGTQGAPFGEFLVGKRPKSLVSAQPTNPFATDANAANTTSPFGASAAAPATSAFGQPSALGQKPNPFATPSFGQPAQPAAASGFGQSSTFGQPTSAFGQPVQSNAFGQASQPSAFGQPAQPTPSPFSQPAQPTTSAFGQPSALGVKPSPFGAPSFGQAAQPTAGANNNNQQSAFGQASQLGQKPNPFGGNTNVGPSPFAAAATASTANNNTDRPANPFATTQQPQQPAANPFGNQAQSTNNNNVSPFAAQAQAQFTKSTVNPFAQQEPATSSRPNPFATGASPSPAAHNPFATGGQQAAGVPPKANPFAPAQASTPAASNPFATSSTAPAQQQQAGTAPSAPAGNPYPPGSGKQHPPAESYISKGMDGTLSAFKGKAVSYNDGKPGIRAFDGTWTRIWFPNGAPAYYKDTELPIDSYDDKTKAQWLRFEQTGVFADGVMPALPPPREYTVWDF